MTKASITKTSSNATNAASRMLRKIGLKDEPGSSSVPMKPVWSVSSAEDDIVGSGQGIVFADVDVPVVVIIMLLLFPPPSPPLPSFSTLLVTGSYHPSAPLHLAISHVLESPQHEVLVLSPSPTLLRKKLVFGFDEWLSHSGSTNMVKNAMSRILILLEFWHYAL